MSKWTRRVAGTVLLALVLVTGLGVPFPGDQAKAASLYSQAKLQRITELDRIAGKNRYETAALIAEKGWPDGATTVILARGDLFADALTAAPLAAMEDAPILLTASQRLNPETRRAIQKLRPDTVVILGGIQAISPNVEYQLRQMGITVERISGANRYSTAAQIAERVGLGVEAIVVNGEQFPDALSVSAYAAQAMIPILLTKAQQLPEETLAAVEQVEKTIVVGGEQAVSSTVYKQLPQPRRIAGQDRFQTSVQVIEQLKMATVDVLFTTGWTYADALTGSVLAAKHGAPILLVDRHRLPESVLTWMKRRSIHYGTIVGGPQAVADSVSRQVVQLLNEEVQFNDPVLEAAIRTTLNKPRAPITRSDLGAIQELVIFGEEVHDLDGLELVSNLMALELSFAGIKDISPLSQLSQLHYLALWGNQIEDISPLRHLEKLVVLDLDENKVADLSPLRDLKQLSALFASMNQIKDLSPLANLDNLSSLFLAENQIEEITALDNKEMLMFLDLSGNQIRFVPELNLPGLMGLSLANNQIVDLAPLKSFTHLMELYLDFNRIKTISPLEHLTELAFLSLASNQIEDISPLNKMPDLLGLYLDYNQIRDLSPIAGLSRLVELSFSYNQISDLSPLMGKRQLAILNASGNQISQVPSLQLNGLMFLQLDDNNLSSLSFASELTNLLILTAAHNEISSLSGLETLAALEVLDVNHNKIDSLNPLRALANLTLLDASYNNLTGFSPLEGKLMPILLLNHNKMTDLAPVEKMKELMIFMVANNEIEDIAPLYHYVLNSGMLMLGDVRGNRIDLSEGSEQKMYVDAIEGMGVEFYAIPQQELATTSSQAYDDDALRNQIKEEQLESMRQTRLKDGLAGIKKLDKEKILAEIKAEQRWLR